MTHLTTLTSSIVLADHWRDGKGEAEGGKVVAALVLVDRQEGGREAIESRGIPVFPMFTRATIFGDK